VRSKGGGGSGRGRLRREAGVIGVRGVSSTDTGDMAVVLAVIVGCANVSMQGVGAGRQYSSVAVC
jgi:hypothetical protein